MARHFADHGMVALLPLALPCKMDAFGLITRTDRLLSPAGQVMLRAIKSAALTIYGKELDAGSA
jgi:DNA-binding transcriptional LysR family regulator